jgi:hypothetical protein
MCPRWRSANGLGHKLGVVRRLVITTVPIHTHPNNPRHVLRTGHLVALPPAVAVARIFIEDAPEIVVDEVALRRATPPGDAGHSA